MTYKCIKTFRSSIRGNYKLGQLIGEAEFNILPLTDQRNFAIYDIESVKNSVLDADNDVVMDVPFDYF